jgi:hypothetical protein
MFGQLCWVPEAPDPPDPPWAGAVVDGLEELAGGEGLGLAASAGIENARTAPSAAPPTTGVARSSSLRLSGIFASCNGVSPSVREGSLPTTVRPGAQDGVGEALEFHWNRAARAHDVSVMPHALGSA